LLGFLDADLSPILERHECRDASAASYRIGQAASKGIGERQNGERGSVGDAELLINMVQVNLHGPLSQP
jgi:hypothetical protein